MSMYFYCNFFFTNSVNSVIMCLNTDHYILCISSNMSFRHNFQRLLSLPTHIFIPTSITAFCLYSRKLWCKFLCNPGLWRWRHLHLLILESLLERQEATAAHPEDTDAGNSRSGHLFFSYQKCGQNFFALPESCRLYPFLPTSLYSGKYCGCTLSLFSLDFSYILLSWLLWLLILEPPCLCTFFS